MLYIAAFIFDTVFLKIIWCVYWDIKGRQSDGQESGGLDK